MDQQLSTLAIVAVLVGLLVRLLKTNRVDLFLAMLRIPPIPKPALPWIALLLGATTMVLDAMLSGATLREGVIAAVAGLFAGAGAVAGNETVPNVAYKIAPKTTNVVFGKANPTAVVKTALDVAIKEMAEPMTTPPKDPQ